MPDDSEPPRQTTTTPRPPIKQILPNHPHLRYGIVTRITTITRPPNRQARPRWRCTVKRLIMMRPSTITNNSSPSYQYPQRMDDGRGCTRGMTNPDTGGNDKPPRTGSPNKTHRGGGGNKKKIPNPTKKGVSGCPFSKGAYIRRQPTTLKRRLETFRTTNMDYNQ